MNEENKLARREKSFEELKQINQYGAEYWSARDLRPMLGYNHWRSFDNAVTKAMVSCEKSGNEPKHHFARARKPIIGGKRGERIMSDFVGLDFSGYSDSNVIFAKGAIMRKIFYILLLMPAVLFCGCEKKQTTQNKEAEKMTIKVTSPAFEQGGMIPSKYTADGRNISPPLKWEIVPAGTASIALISDDPDAPVGTWVHWVMWNVPPDKIELPENVPTDPKLPDGSVQGITDFGEPGYGGPAPPSGTHRYFFKIYALDKKLDLPESSTKADLVKAMQGHILAQGELMGKYKRQ